MVIRQEYSQVPPKVEYSLSEIRKRFELILDTLSDFGMEYIEFYNKTISEENQRHKQYTSRVSLDEEIIFRKSSLFPLPSAYTVKKQSEDQF